MGSFLETLKKLGVVRLGAVGLALALLGGFFFYTTAYLTQPAMGLLYSDLDLKDSGEVAQKLDAMGVVYQVRGDGSTILVAADQVAKLRLALAATGLPHGGSVGYELFDKPEGLGTTDFTQNINEVRALEGELERTIGSIELVQTARVHLVLPKRELFSREMQEPSASILLRLRGNTGLAKPQVAAIQNLVAAAVPGLKPYRIAIIDQNGTLLAREVNDPAELNDGGSSIDEQRAAYESRLAQATQEMLERSVGPGHVRVDVNADMDFDRTTTSAESYDPDGQVVRSTQTVNDQSSDSGSGSGDQPVTVQTNLPEGQQTQGGGGAGGTASKNARTEETTNYEISKKQVTQTHDAGIVKRLSVAVLVDGTYSSGKNGERSYQPRTADEIKQLSAIVKSAIGFDEKRGDRVELVNMRFAMPDDIANDVPPFLFGLSKPDVFRGAETLVVAIVALLVMLLVVRPLISRAIDAAREAATDHQRALAKPAIAGALTGPGGTMEGTAGGAADDDQMIDISQIDGRVKASSMKKIGEIVEKHPEEAVAIIRSWMYQST